MYFTFKALHLIGMVCWFAGLFYMFRLFVYWTENRDDGRTGTLLGTMSRRLYYYITWPSLAVTAVFGLSMLAVNPFHLKFGWMHVKLVLVFGLIGYHLFIGYTLKRFARGDFFLNSKQCRMINEAPVLFLIPIVFLAVYKSF